MYRSRHPDYVIKVVEKESYKGKFTPIRALFEKKLLKAEKRRFGDQRRQVAALKAALFPQDNLQERVDNILPWYAMYGPGFIRELYRQSPVLEQEFVVLTES